MGFSVPNIISEQFLVGLDLPDIVSEQFFTLVHFSDRRCFGVSLLFHTWMRKSSSRFFHILSRFANKNPWAFGSCLFSCWPLHRKGYGKTPSESTKEDPTTQPVKDGDGDSCLDVFFFSRWSVIAELSQVVSVDRKQGLIGVGSRSLSHVAVNGVC